jgi:hypothetical protein
MKTEFTEAMQLLSAARPKFIVDGDRYCFLLGENIQEGIVGFGETEWDAALDFITNFMREL